MKDNIRTTPDKRISVIDAIAAKGGHKNPWMTWSRLIEEHPEVLHDCESFQFKGRGQRATPVMSTEAFEQLCAYLPRPHHHPQKGTYLYLIQQESTNLFKIGISHNPERRFQSIQSSMPYRLKLIETWFSKDGYEQEQRLKYKLLDYKVKGEWFKLSPAQVSVIRNTLRKTQQLALFA